MSERPILFSGPMVRAILEGRKTQTRRIIGLPSLKPSNTHGYDWTFRGRAPIRTIAQQARLPPLGCWQDVTAEQFLALCPYGKVGERLWVRETWCFASPEYPFVGSDRPVSQGGDRCYYRATDGELERDDGGSPWRPSIHMPRWASRICLRVHDVRVQRLQEISEEEARAEGLHWWSKDGQLRKWGLGERHRSGELDFVEEWADMAHSHAEAFRRLWDSINAKRAPWASNPWVWSINFERAAAEAAHKPANPHPSGCHTEAPGSRDCNSDGHESCLSCSRRAERDEEVGREGGIVVPPRRGFKP